MADSKSNVPYHITVDSKKNKGNSCGQWGGNGGNGYNNATGNITDTVNKKFKSDTANDFRDM